MECVKGLDQQIPDKDGNLMDTDATWMAKKFKADGSCCDCIFTDAAEHGSAVERERLYWGIIRNLHELVDQAEVTRFLRALFNSFKIGKLIGVVDCIVLGAEEGAAVRAARLVVFAQRWP